MKRARRSSAAGRPVGACPWPVSGRGWTFDLGIQAPVWACRRQARSPTRRSSEPKTESLDEFPPVPPLPQAASDRPRCAGLLRRSPSPARRSRATSPRARRPTCRSARCRDGRSATRARTTRRRRWPRCSAPCDGSYLMLGGSPESSTTLSVLAAAPRADVLFDTGHTNTPHNANGSGWYFATDWSWGFAPQGQSIQRAQCDAVTGALRLCWQHLPGPRGPDQLPGRRTEPRLPPRRHLDLHLPAGRGRRLHPPHLRGDRQLGFARSRAARLRHAAAEHDQRREGHHDHQLRGVGHEHDRPHADGHGPR